MPRKQTNTSFSWLQVTEDGRLLLSSTEAAGHFGVTRKTIDEWAKAGCPQEERGWFDIKAVMNWLQTTESQGDGAFNEARKLKADILWKEQRAAIAEIERGVKENLFYSKAEVERAWATRVLEVKAILLGLANTLAGEFTDPDIRAEVRRVVGDETRRALEQYSREGVYTPHRWDSGVASSGEACLETTRKTDS